MPLYDYRCENCGHQFEAKHGFDAPMPPCPNCKAADVKRLIITVPTISKGILADAGVRGKATKEQLQDKWAEETPKLRDKLVSKLGEDFVSKNAPSLGSSE